MIRQVRRDRSRRTLDRMHEDAVCLVLSASFETILRLTPTFEVGTASRPGSVNDVCGQTLRKM